MSFSRSIPNRPKPNLVVGQQVNDGKDNYFLHAEPFMSKLAGYDYMCTVIAPNSDGEHDTNKKSYNNIRCSSLKPGWLELHEIKAKHDKEEEQYKTIKKNMEKEKNERIDNAMDIINNPNNKVQHMLLFEGGQHIEYYFMHNRKPKMVRLQRGGEKAYVYDVESNLLESDHNGLSPSQFYNKYGVGFLYKKGGHNGGGFKRRRNTRRRRTSRKNRTKSQRK